MSDAVELCCDKRRMRCMHSVLSRVLAWAHRLFWPSEFEPFQHSRDPILPEAGLGQRARGLPRPATRLPSLRHESQPLTSAYRARAKRATNKRMPGQAAMSSAREIAAKLRGGVSDGPPPRRARGGFSDVKSKQTKKVITQLSQFQTMGISTGIRDGRLAADALTRRTCASWAPTRGSAFCRPSAAPAAPSSTARCGGGGATPRPEIRGSRAPSSASL